MRAPTTAKIDSRLAACWTACKAYSNSPFTTNTLKAVASLIASECISGSRKLTPAQETALVTSLEHLVDQIPDEAMLKANIHRIIANFHFVMEGMAVPEWHGDKTPAEVVFIGVRRTGKVKKGVPIYEVKFKLKTGLCAGIILCGSLYSTAMYSFVDHKAGVSKYRCPPEDIAGMQASLIVSIEDGLPHIYNWDTTQRQKEHNKLLEELRAQPNKCRAGVPCNACSKNIKQCNLAVWLPPERSI